MALNKHMINLRWLSPLLRKPTIFNRVPRKTPSHRSLRGRKYTLKVEEQKRHAHLLKTSHLKAILTKSFLQLLLITLTSKKVTTMQQKSFSDWSLRVPVKSGSVQYSPLRTAEAASVHDLNSCWTGKDNRAAVTVLWGRQPAVLLVTKDVKFSNAGKILPNASIPELNCLWTEASVKLGITAHNSLQRWGKKQKSLIDESCCNHFDSLLSLRNEYSVGLVRFCLVWLILASGTHNTSIAITTTSKKKNSHKGK